MATFIMVEQEGVQLLDNDGEYNWSFQETSQKFLKEDGTTLKSFEAVVRDHGPVTIVLDSFESSDLDV